MTVHLNLHPQDALPSWRSSALAEQVALERIIGGGKQGSGTAVVALGDVVRVAGNDEAGEAGPCRIALDLYHYVN